MILISAAARVQTRSLGLMPAVALLTLMLFPRVAQAAAIRIMPLGDSITVGKFSDVVPDDPAYYVSYRKILKDLLAAAGHETNFVGSQVAGDAVFGDAQHEGHGGWFADDAANPDLSILPNVFDFLQARPAEIVLLHIGTNDIGFYDPGNAVVSEVSAILDEIDRYNPDVWVVLALVINRANGCEVTAETTNFNDLLYAMAQARAQGGDRISVVDMEVDAGLDYDLLPDGDMVDCPHPYRTGFRKMADAWFRGLSEILPKASAGVDQNAKPGDSVFLDGTGSSDSLGTIVSYAWSQTAGTPVALLDGDKARASFTAPALDGGDTLTFRLTITDDQQHTHSDECVVTVSSQLAPDGASGPGGGGGGGGGGCFITASGV